MGFVFFFWIHVYCYFFVISSSKYGGVLFAVLCGVVLFPVFLQCLLDSYWKIDYLIKDLGINVANPEACVFRSL